MCLKHGAAIGDAAHHHIAKTIEPGARETDLQAAASAIMHKLGAQWVHNVQVTSGNRTQPHPHLSSDRLIQPGDLVFIDIVLLLNGYHTCYYRCFCCGQPTARQKDIHKRCLAYQQAGLAAVKPGVTTADITKVWPKCSEMGFNSEAECFVLQYGHGIGVGLWEFPIVSRLYSMDHPVEIKPGMVFALANKACSVTTNPILAASALKNNPVLQSQQAKALPDDAPANERAEANLKGVVQHAAKMFEPIYRASEGKQGYVCAQVNPALAADRDAMIATARRFHRWAPNIAVKFPATLAGLDAQEECIAEGITITSTVNYTVPQVIAAAERHRRGRQRAREAGKKPGECFAVVMIGRLDDYLREVARDNQIQVSEEDICQAGLAVVKRAYTIFKKKNYDATLLIAALRGTYHMTELVGGELLMSIHPTYQQQLLDPQVPQEQRIDKPIDRDVIERLNRIPEFARAYEPDGMQPREFITYGVVQKTLMQFQLAGWAKLH